MVLINAQNSSCIALEARACCQNRHVKGGALMKAEWKLFSLNATVIAICCEKAHTHFCPIWETQNFAFDWSAKKFCLQGISFNYGVFRFNIPMKS